MRYARKTFAIVAFAALFGCSVQSPATTLTSEKIKLPLHSTQSTFAFSSELTASFSATYVDTVIEVREGYFASLLEQLEAGSIDYFISSHVPATDGIWSAPLATDGVAIIVNPNNRATNLEVDQLRSIFAGQQTDWAEFGDPRLEIVPLTYQADSDLSLEFQRMVMGATVITGNARLVPGIEAMLQAVAEHEGAIGYLPLSMLNSSVDTLAINGVHPNAGTMRDKVYPLRSTLFVIGREEPQDAYFNFIGWIQSDSGQAIVAESMTALP